MVGNYIRDEKSASGKAQKGKFIIPILLQKESRQKRKGEKELGKKENIIPE